MIAKEWRDKNSLLKDSGNIRNYTDLLHLIILNNLETINSVIIKDNIEQSEN